mmetsp:Transcript_32277/g.67858  ORF Transcript_32277/g.67858 Transcript_32277/m.67858 type:complete len:853 (-) Transcript_32277:67-2625(-)
MEEITEGKSLEEITDDDSDVEMIGPPKQLANQSTVKKSKKNDVKKNVLMLTEIFEYTEVEEGEEKWNSEKWQDNGLPSLVKFKTTVGSSDVWKVIRQLTKPITQISVAPSTARKVKSLQFKLNAPTVKKHSHVCLLCLEEVTNLGLEGRHNESWAKALCKVTNSGNGMSHLVRCHSAHKDVKAILEKKEAEENAQGVLDAIPPAGVSEPSNSTTQSNTVGKNFIKQQKKAIIRLQARWLGLNGIPHHYTQVPEFAEMFRLFDKNFVPIARETFMKELEKLFKRMIQGIIKLVETNREELSGLRWLSICHDMWNTLTMDGALGSSLKLTTKDMETYTIAAILEKNNVSHSAPDIGAQLQKTYMERFGIDLKKETNSCAADTCKAAANVAGVLEADGEDCEMHIVSLIMGYGLGVKENTKTKKFTDDKGVVKKVQSIVTPGGAFPEGKRLVKGGRNCVNYFSKSPQRKEKMDAQRKIMDLSTVALMNFPETRVGYIVTTLQSLMANHQLLSILQVAEKDDFGKLWDELSNEDFKAIQEMEAVTQILFSYSVNDSQQSNAFNNSLLPWYRKLLKKALYQDSYRVMKLGKQAPTTKLRNWPREIRKVIDFTPSGKQCLNRLQEQLKMRLPAPKPNQCLSVLLDPATKAFAEILLDEDGLFHKTRALLKEKHRDAWRAFHAPVDDKEGDNGEEEELATPKATAMDLDEDDEEEDDEDDILGMTCELEANDADPEEDTTERDADDVFEKWMNHTVKFSKYVFDSQQPMKAVGAVKFKELVAKFDTMKYYREKGKEEWPTITILARIHFSKMDNSAFQERVFSTAANVMSKVQNRMGFAHLEMRTLLAQNKDLIRQQII